MRAKANMVTSRPPAGIRDEHWFIDVLNLVFMDVRQFFDNRLFAVSTFLTSVSMVFAFGFATGQMVSPTPQASSYFDFVFPGILAAGIMFSCTYTIGYTMIIDRNRRTMEDLILSPLSYSGFLMARFLGVVIKCLFQFLLVLILGLVMFDARIDSIASLSLTFVSGCLAFAGLGVVVATYTNEISFPAVVNIIVIPLLYFAGVFFPIQNLGMVGKVLARLPLSVHVDMFRSATGQGPPASLLSISLTIAYAVAGIGISSFLFRRRISNHA
jgi:ABC-2 type transport system permease protein